MNASSTRAPQTSANPTPVTFAHAGANRSDGLKSALWTNPDLALAHAANLERIGITAE
jgi:hypothetical protein